LIAVFLKGAVDLGAGPNGKDQTGQNDYKIGPVKPVVKKVGHFDSSSFGNIIPIII
jgi:hypothetical protein